MATGAFLGLAGEGLGLGALTALVTSLAIVLVARLALGGSSSSVSDVFLALVLAAGFALTLTFSLAAVASFEDFVALDAAGFLTGDGFGLVAISAFFATALGLAAFLAAGFATSGLSSTSATYTKQIFKKK